MTLRGLIILDGADCSGKSTLAQAVKERAEAKGATAVIHHSAPIEGSDCWDVHSQGLLSHVQEAFVENKVVIMDRLFLSEAIYGAVYRGGSVYPHAARHIDRLLHRFRALRVVCAPPVEFVVEKHRQLKQERDELYDDVTDVAMRYRALWHGVDPAVPCDRFFDAQADYVQHLTLTGGIKDRPGWYLYDLTTDGADMQRYASYLLDELVEEQKSALDYTLDLADIHTHTGFARTGAVLLVGDRLAGPNALSVPFYANSGSSLYLAKTLHKLEVEEDRLVICNVNDPGGVSQVRTLAAWVNFKKIIVLGRQAERTMLQEKIRFDVSVRHPQHARRFSHNDDTYEKELRDALL